MEVLADQADRISRLVADVELYEWLPNRPAIRVVGLIPGWGGHPYLYGPLIRELVRANVHVVATWSSNTDGLASDSHFAHLPEFIERLRHLRGFVGIVGESLGATYLLASRRLLPSDRVVLLAPGILLRSKQVLSAPALRDILALIVHNKLPLTTWRLETVSDNPEFLRAARLPDLVPLYSGRQYLARALAAALKAIARPTRSDNMWIIQGGSDRLLSPAGAMFLARRLGPPRPRFLCIERVGHGVLWDQSSGQQIAAEIAEYFTYDD
jgi:pimeloyl-ACP methyl ester carboxylesterase